MADRRMIDRAIVTEGRFLDLPTNSKLLYMMLIVHADDEGFVDPGAVIRLIGVDKADLEPLEEASLIFTFPSGAICIKDWFIHNTVRKDMAKKTRFEAERMLLDKGTNKVYFRLEELKSPAS